MNLNERIEALVDLGKYLARNNEQLQAVVASTYIQNRWFTVENIYLAINAIIKDYLQPENLKNWLSNYTISKNNDQITIGLILAGNIPLVGFYDMMCTFFGRIQIKNQTF